MTSPWWAHDMSYRIVMRSRAILLPRRPRSASGKRSKYASTCGEMSTTVGVMPSRSQTTRASASDADDDVRYGIRMASTFSGPRAAHAMAALSAESMPPDRPTTTRSKPTLRTSLRTNPTRMSRTTSLSIESASTSETVCLGVVDVMSFIPEQGVGDASASHRCQVDAVEHEALVTAGRVVEKTAIGTDGTRPSPEADAVLEPHAVAVQQVRGKELRVGPRHGVVAARRAQRMTMDHASAGGGRRADEELAPPTRQQPRGCGVPHVLADEHARLPWALRPGGIHRGGEGAEPVALGQVPCLVEESIRRQVHLAMDVMDATLAEVEGRVVE